MGIARVSSILTARITVFFVNVTISLSYFLFLFLF